LFSVSGSRDWPAARQHQQSEHRRQPRRPGGRSRRQPRDLRCNSQQRRVRAPTRFKSSTTRPAHPAGRPDHVRFAGPGRQRLRRDGGDPIVLYDRQAGRWFMLVLDSSNLCTYVSKTSDPVTGGWWAYNYPTPSLPDYPHCGVWDDAYVCGDNEGGAQQSVYAFDRANMLNGATARPAQRFASIPKTGGLRFPDPHPGDVLRHHRRAGGPQADPRPSQRRRSARRRRRQRHPGLHRSV
jgi:hypothetical protein